LKADKETLDLVSGQLFIIGFFSARLKTAPIMILAAIFNIVALSAYLIGYLVWYLAALCYPEHKRKQESWYGFAQFKEQFQVAAIIGTIATIMCLIAPELIIPATWLYGFSNTLWSIGEYHKKESPPPEDFQYSSAKQAFYFRYTLFIASSSIITALGATIAFLFPAAALIAVMSSTVIGLSLIATAAYYWGNAYFGTFTPDRSPDTYGTVRNQLSSVSDNNNNTYAPAPDLNLEDTPPSPPSYPLYTQPNPNTGISITTSAEVHPLSPRF